MNINWIMGTGQNRTHMVKVLDHGNRIVTTNVSSATVTVLEKVREVPLQGGAVAARPIAPLPGGDWEETVIPVGGGSEGFDVTADGNWMWVAGAVDGNVSVIDLKTKKVTSTIPAEAKGVNRLQFTLDGKLALLSTPVDVVVLDTATHKVIKHIATGHGGGGIQMDPSGLRAFESCGGDNYIAVIDLKTLTVTGHIAIKGPDGLAWASR
jgi:YVTN family beta-propeller protein